MKTLLFLLIANLGLAQSLTPTIGLHWTGGLSYEMEHELPSAQIGLVYTPKKPLKLLSNIGVSGHYYYDFLNENPKVNYNDFYVIRLQAAKEFIEFWNFTYYVGYANAFDNNLMKSFKGDFSTNFSYGFGIQTTDPYMTAEFLFESIAGYPHLSIGLNLNVVNLLKKK